MNILHTNTSLNKNFIKLFKFNEFFQYCDGGRGECVPYYLCENNTVITDGTGIIDIRFSEDSPCDYLSVCCGGGSSHDPNKGANTGGTSSGTIVDKPIVPPPKHRSGCGYHNKDGVGFKITGNTDEAEFGEVSYSLNANKTRY